LWNIVDIFRFILRLPIIDSDLIYSQTCIKRSPSGQRKNGLLRKVTSKRGSIHIKSSMTGQKSDILIQVTA